MSQAIGLRELAISRGRSTRQLGVCQAYAIALMNGTRPVGSNAINKIAHALELPTEVVYAACQESRRRATEQVTHGA